MGDITLNLDVSRYVATCKDESITVGSPDSGKPVRLVRRAVWWLRRRIPRRIPGRFQSFLLPQLYTRPPVLPAVPWTRLWRLPLLVQELQSIFLPAVLLLPDSIAVIRINNSHILVFLIGGKKELPYFAVFSDYCLKLVSYLLYYIFLSKIR